MATLTTDELADLVTTTQKNLGRGKWTDLSSDLQEYVAMPKLMKEKKVTFDGGQGIQWNLLMNDNSQARNVGLMEVDQFNVVDGIKTANIPWRHSTTNYSVDGRAVSMNAASDTKIVDLVKVGRTQAWVALAKLMETNFWGKPTSSSDETTPYGIDYWVVKNATAGFNGGIPSGFSDVAGLSPTTYTRWKNYTDQYTNITKPDCLAKIRQALTKTNFRPPVEMAQYATENKFGLYMNYDVLSALETLAENQNENLGNDLASKDGLVSIRRTLATYVPELDSDAQDPIYGINWGAFNFVFLKGWYMKEEKAYQHPLIHTSVVTNVDLTYNMRCVDRRKLFIVNIA